MNLETSDIKEMIYLIRGQKVMIDSDLAKLYGVETKRLNEQVRRNLDRFPGDFMFQLTPDEFNFLKSQIATSKASRGGKVKQPLVFTENGVAMLSTVLIAKLKLGFVINGFEQDEVMGTLVRMIYHHDMVRKNAFEYRVGKISNASLMKSFEKELQ